MGLCVIGDGESVNNNNITQQQQQQPQQKCDNNKKTQNNWPLVTLGNLSPHECLDTLWQYDYLMGDHLAIASIDLFFFSYILCV